MILTNRAKEDFLSWYGTGENYFNTTISEIEQNANIIEWFDEVGIYISNEITAQVFSYDIKVYSDNIDFGCKKYVGEVYKTRQKANSKAIEKANDIYNNLNK